MEYKIIERIAFFVIVLIPLLVGFFFMVMQHETTHVTINKYYGMESHYEWSFSSWSSDGIVAKTIVDSNPENCEDSCRLAHAQNEIRGYSDLAWLFFIWSIFATIMYFWKGEKDNEF